MTAAFLAMVLVILQALIMVHLSGRARIYPLQPATLSRRHRRQGDVLLVLFLLVAYHYVTKAEVYWGDWRSAAHAGFAMVTLAAVVAKLLMVQVFPRTMKYITAVGLTLVVGPLGATGTAVVWYFYMWLVRGIRPLYSWHSAFHLPPLVSRGR